MLSKQCCTCLFRKRGFETQLRKSLHQCSKICSSASSLQASFHNASLSRTNAFAIPPVHCHRLSRFNNQVPRRGKVTFTKRTHLCGELTADNIGEDVRLCGWVVFNRLVGTFLVIRDWTGIVQLKIPEELANEKIYYESVVEACGKVIARPEGMENKNMSTGAIEIEVSSFKILNECKADLPMDLREVVQNKESIRMEYRYLDIRSKQMQNNLRLRSSVIMKMREFLSNQHGFVDVETPTLFRRTPGGAKEFVVPSRQHGKFYSLPQSPQQFKQLLMVGGIDRYYQIAKCYRDEGSRPDRQPEFTQVDIEMSFVEKNDIQTLIEQLLQYSWPADKGNINIPFPRMTYQQAMEDYGSDKPDLRYNLKLERLTDLLKDSGENMWAGAIQDGDHVIGLRLPDGMKHLSKKEITTFKEAMKQKQVKSRFIKIKSQSDLNGETNSVIASKLKLEPGDVVVTATGSGYLPHIELGKILTMFTKKMDVPSEKFNFLWVEEFPLFLEKEDGEEGLESAHHPFTAPHKDDLDLVYSQPDKVRSEHYDLVLNGAEIGGGSIRIHDSKLQTHVLQNVLKEDTSELEHLLKALELGCPPHGGIALGLDRLLAILCGAQSIRDVIAFPKTQEGNDLMSNAPSTITDEDLDLYHIQVKPMKSTHVKDSS